MVERPGITFHQLQTFVAVARSGNLSTAARELNTTQPTVSLQLRALRQTLGAQLFERPGGRFRLTPAGERLRRFAEETLEALDAMRQDIAVLKGHTAGSLVIGVTHFVTNRIMPLLPSFRAQFPDVRVQAHVDRPNALFIQLLAGTVDVVCFVNVPTPPNIVVERFGKEELIVIASPQHRLAHRRRITADELSKERFVCDVSPFRELVEARLRAAGITPQTIEEVQNYERVRVAVEQNRGYSMHVKPMVAGQLASGHLVGLKVDRVSLTNDLVIGFRLRPGMTPLIREFMAFLRREHTDPHGFTATTSQRLTRKARRRRSKPKPR